MSKITNDVLKKIKNEKIRPRPRWEFIAWNIGLWTVFIFSVIIGSLAVSIICNVLFTSDWQAARQIAGGHVKGFFLLVPYLWILALLLTIFAAGKLFEKTEKGYRYNPKNIILVTVTVSIFFGTLFHIAGLGRNIENQMHGHIPPYQQWNHFRQKTLSNPEKGVLIGVILELDEKSSLILLDIDDERWLVDINEAVTPPIPLQINMTVGVKGQITGPSRFKAEGIRPWMRPHDFGIRMGPPPPPPKQF